MLSGAVAAQCGEEMILSVLVDRAGLLAWLQLLFKPETCFCKDTRKHVCVPTRQRVLCVNVGRGRKLIG